MHWPSCARPWPRSRAMNEPFDALEAELTALQPRQPSPELKSRLAQQLSNAPQRLVKGIALRVAIAAGLAACVIVAVVVWRTKPVVVTQPRRENVQPLVANVFDESVPSVWAYHRAVSA